MLKFDSRLLTFNLILNSRIRQYSTSTIIKERETKLTSHLKKLIKSSGPISFYEYMKYCVSSGSRLGYYQQDKPIFGKQGDFITSPEISQTFGELIGLDYIQQYQLNGDNKDIHLIELGPGKGTLMMDMLRTLERFPSIYKNVQQIHLIETSSLLANYQKESIVEKKIVKQIKEEEELIDNFNTNIKLDHIQLNWYSGLDAFKLKFDNLQNQYFCLMAHEFFDALPIHKFKKLNSEWREIMVDINEENTDPYHFKTIINPKKTLPLTYLNHITGISDESGDDLEYSPQVNSIINQMKDIFKNNKGYAQIWDYGYNHNINNGIRGIYQHQFTSPLSLCGETDLSSDVNFEQISELIQNQPSSLTVSELKTQKDYLLRMGIQERLKILFESKKKKIVEEKNLSNKEKYRQLEEYQTLLLSDYNRLIDQMGQIFKVLILKK
ncbi:DUF185-domain-containing protein [Neoconidiobolus thromboides FSU 785]|nr:DUF185-domain-containing protein [Neoconidiobolus thromboides FSU 785]